MAIFTRTHGDARGITHVDISRSDVAGGGIGSIISTGIGKHPTMFLVTAGADLRGEMGVGGLVETLTRMMATKATVIAYQVEDNDSGEVRVLVEATGWNDDADLQAALRTISGLGSATVSSANGFAA